MTDCFLAEIRMFAGNFAPAGWALCNGQLMPISQNTALFSLLGTMYGGDGRVTFGLPNLMDSAPMQSGQGAGLSQRIQGEVGGEAAVTLLAAEMPAHSHLPNAYNGRGDSSSPAGRYWAQAGVSKSSTTMYSSNAPDQPMNPLAVGVTGGGQGHNNMPPYLGLTFIIALEGIFPSRG
jgi:microcystin-dependent protein